MTNEQKLQETLRQLEIAQRSMDELQARLARSQKMAALGTLVASVAHELNTPIGALRSMHQSTVQAVQQLKRTLNEAYAAAPDKLAAIQKSLSVIDEAHAVISSAADRIARVALLLRDRGRAGTAERTPVNINLAIADALTLLSYDWPPDIQVIRELGSLPTVMGDASQLDQVLLNILMNARQAIAKEGWIRVRTSVQGDRVIVAISDSGCGIPEENLAQLFEPGFTTRGASSGMGLGLYICRQIVSAHGGEIAVSSTPGTGSEFTIALPADSGSRREAS